MNYKSQLINFQYSMSMFKYKQLLDSIRVHTCPSCPYVVSVRVEFLNVDIYKECSSRQNNDVT